MPFTRYNRHANNYLFDYYRIWTRWNEAEEQERFVVPVCRHDWLRLFENRKCALWPDRGQVEISLTDIERVTDTVPTDRFRMTAMPSRILPTGSALVNSWILVTTIMPTTNFVIIPTFCYLPLLIVSLTYNFFFTKRYNNKVV